MYYDPSQSYHAQVDAFAWEIPNRLNMAWQACGAWAQSHPDQIAVIDATLGQKFTYADLERMSKGLARYLLDHNLARGDRVGVLRSQSVWTAVAHLAIWRIGAISIPLFKLFGPDALMVRVVDAGAKALIVDEAPPACLAEFRGLLVHPEALQLEGDCDYAATHSQDPAVLIYTSGTTGAPKGALHAHRVLTGHLPGVAMSHNGLGAGGDCLWTPADWAWIGGLFDVLMPGLALGVPVVATRADKFTPDWAADVIAAHSIRNVFFPPTALRMLKAADQAIPHLRSVASGGEPLGAEMLTWGQSAFGLTINEFYGQTECNMVLSSASDAFDPRPGCIGKPVPGFDIAILDYEGNPIEQGEGDIAIARGGASMMLEYWNQPEATSDKFKGGWMLTGDRGQWCDGYVQFIGREDDVITTSGYRVGPSEIEDCLLRHPSVATVGVVGKPDPLRTEIVKAYVVVKDGVEADHLLAEDLKAFVKDRLARHSYPREIEFCSELPMTVTGKIIRKTLRARACDEAAENAADT